MMSPHEQREYSSKILILVNEELLKLLLAKNECAILPMATLWEIQA